MKKIIILLLLSIISWLTPRCQCPVGATALYTIYVNVDPWGNGDTTCSFTVYNFPPSSNVYFYSNSAVLLDSVVTNTSGYGRVEHSSTNCIYINGVPPIPLGNAVSGTCTKNIDFAGLLATKIKTFEVGLFDNKINIAWQLEQEDVGTKYEIEESTNGVNFYSIYKTSSNLSSSPGKLYQYKITQSLNNRRFYRLKITERNNSITYSDIKVVLPTLISNMNVHPNSDGKNFTIDFDQSFINGAIQIFNTSGSLIQHKKIDKSSINIMLNNTGVFYIKAIATNGSIKTKSIVVQ
jgi:hypothetical protein